MNEELLKFVIWITGHDEETVKQMYNDYSSSPQAKSNLVEAPVMQHTENFNNWLSKYFISDGNHYCYKTKSGHKLFTLKELYKKFEQAYHEKPSVSA